MHKQQPVSQHHQPLILKFNGSVIECEVGKVTYRKQVTEAVHKGHPLGLEIAQGQGKHCVQDSGTPVSWGVMH